MPPNCIDIIIVDDHPMVIEGLKMLLDGAGAIRIKEYFSNGSDTLDYLITGTTDVILLDVNLPDINGVEMVGRILELRPGVKILGLSTYSEPSIINQMIKNGVKGYLLKNATALELENAIKQVYSGLFYFGAEVQKILADTVTQEASTLPKLTRREKDVLKLITEGMTTNTIADTLFISPLTVETHRRNLMQKLQVSNVAGLVKMALERKLI